MKKQITSNFLGNVYVIQKGSKVKKWRPKAFEPFWFMHEVCGKLEVVHTSYFYMADVKENQIFYGLKFKTRKEATQILRQIKQLLKKGV